MRALFENRRGRWAAVVALVALGLTAFAAARAPSGTAAQVVTVACGQTLTASTTVGNDLTNCPGDGLVIGAAGITINLNGHTIDGQFAGIGIRNDSFADVTIRNGAVTEFNRGVVLAEPASNNEVQDLDVARNALSGILASGPASEVAGSAAFDNGSFGIRIQGGASRVATSSANNNGGLGIVSDGSGSTVTGNLALSNGSTGIAVGGEGTQLTSNVSNSNDASGFVVSALTATVSKNKASFNTELGINAESGGVTDGGGNKAAGNGSLHQCENVVCTAP